MDAVQHFVGESAVFPAKDERDGSFSRSSQHFSGSGAWVDDAPFRRATPRSESNEPDAIAYRVIELLEVLDAVDQCARVVCDAFEAIGLVRHRTHQAEFADAHVGHRAHGRRDVDEVLWLVQDDNDVRQQGFVHDENLKCMDCDPSWRSPPRYTNSPSTSARTSL